MGTWIARKTPHRKIVIMASDFVAGRHSVEAFMAAFKAKGVMKGLVERIPVRVILNERTALLGAARYALMSAGRL